MARKERIHVALRLSEHAPLTIDDDLTLSDAVVAIRLAGCLCRYPVPDVSIPKAGRSALPANERLDCRCGSSDPGHLAKFVVVDKEERVRRRREIDLDSKQPRVAGVLFDQRPESDPLANGLQYRDDGARSERERRGTERNHPLFMR